MLCEHFIDAFKVRDINRRLVVKAHFHINQNIPKFEGFQFLSDNDSAGEHPWDQAIFELHRFPISLFNDIIFQAESKLKLKLAATSS